MAGIEIERKYVIRMPSIEKLMAECGFASSAITQIYLNSGAGVTHRVRKREFSDGVRYYETRKTRIDKMSAVEDEREISGEEYAQLSKNIKMGTSPITKTRYTFLSRGKLIEIDVYPEWKNTCILETELTDREEEVKLPDYIEIIKEVTGCFEYSNASMARSFPKELSIK